MTENFDFEIVPSTRGGLANKPQQGSGLDKLASAAADNFGRILDVATTVVEIQKMQVQADAYIGTLRENRLMLEQETEAYVKKLNAETDATVNKVEVIRRMMHDYYTSGTTKLSGDEFSKIISDVLDHMGNI